MFLLFLKNGIFQLFSSIFLVENRNNCKFLINMFEEVRVSYSYINPDIIFHGVVRFMNGTINLYNFILLCK